MKLDYEKQDYSCGLFQVNTPTFEPAHRQDTILEELRFSSNYLDSDGKPYNANLYWKEILHPNLGKDEIKDVPIIKFLQNIISH